MPEGNRWNIAILALLCLAPLLTAGICRSAADEAQSREKVRTLWSEPILAPPPGATELLRVEKQWSLASPRSVTIAYASPHSAKEVRTWYLDRFGDAYRLSDAHLDPDGAVTLASAHDRDVISRLHGLVLRAIDGPPMCCSRSFSTSGQAIRGGTAGRSVPTEWERACPDASPILQTCCCWYK